MTDQISSTETEGDDGFPPVSFSLRNMSGESSAIELRTPMLGMELYILVQAGDDGPVVESSHLTMDELLQALSFVLVTGLQGTESLTEEGRQSVLDVLSIVTEDDE